MTRKNVKPFSGSDDAEDKAMRRPAGRVTAMWRMSGLAFSGLARGDLLDQIDDAAPKLGIGDACESARQRQPFGGCEEIRDVGGRGPLAEPDARVAGRAALEQE